MAQSQTASLSVRDPVIPAERRGLPLLYGIDVDQQVMVYLKAMREAGGKMNRKSLSLAPYV